MNNNTLRLCARCEYQSNRNFVEIDADADRVTGGEGEEEEQAEDNDIQPCDNQMCAFRINGYW